MRLLILTLLLLFSNITFAEDLDFGRWYEGTDSTSFPTLESACENSIIFYSYGRDKEIVNGEIVQVDPYNFKCNFTENSANKYRPVNISLAGVIGGSGSNAARFMITSQELTFEHSYKWFYSNVVFGSNPFQVCKDRIAVYDESQNDHILKYSHLEIFNSSGIPQANQFQCIATKERIDHAGVVGFVSAGRIYTDYEILSDSPITYDFLCESEFCEGYSPDDPSSFDPDYGFNIPPVENDLNSIAKILEDTLASTDVIKFDNSQIKDDVSNIDSRIANMLIDTSAIDENIQELVTAQQGYQESLDVISNSLNTDIILALEDLGIEDDIVNVITAIENSNTNTINKLDTISSLLSNSSSNNLDFSDLVSAINANNIDSEINDLKQAVNDSSTNQAAASLASTNSIVDAINSLDTTKDTSPDTSAIEDLNQSIKDLDNSLNPTELNFEIDPNLDSESLWDSSYPDGLKGVWIEKLSDFQDTSLVNWLNSFASNFEGQANTPVWNFCFDLGFINFGCSNLEFDDRIFAAIRLFMMLTASFYARRIIFGG